MKKICLGILLAVLLLGVGCQNPFQKKSAKEVEEVLVNEDNEVVQAEDKKDQTPQKEEIKSFSYQLFFIFDDYSGISPELYSVKETALGEKTLPQYTMDKLMDQKNFGGYLSPIPKETKLLSLKVNDNQALLDFSKEFQTNMPSDMEKTKLHVMAIVNTLTYLNEIESVLITVEGKSLKDIHGFNMNEAFIYTEDFYFDK